VNDFTSVLDQTSDQVNNYNVHCLVNTDDLVVAMETGDKNSGIIGSLDWLSLETNFEHSKTGLYIFLNFW
jgi:hypothetical protein